MMGCMGPSQSALTGGVAGPIGVVSCLSMPTVLLLKREHSEQRVEHGQAADFSFIGEWASASAERP